jgi:TusA-related sulfurtransferase
MTLRSKLNLVGVAWPVSLLKFKTASNSLSVREVLDVLTRDPDVVANIILLVNRSEDTLIDQQKEGEVYRLSVQKG